MASHVSAPVEEQNQFVSRTVMSHNVTDEAASNLFENKTATNDKPNRPVDEHFGAVVDLEKPDQTKLKEQVVYNRLPKDYFMADAEDQMDIDIAVNDIKQMRNGFISYVNENHQPAD